MGRRPCCSLGSCSLYSPGLSALIMVLRRMDLGDYPSLDVFGFLCNLGMSVLIMLLLRLSLGGSPSWGSGHEALGDLALATTAVLALASCGALALVSSSCFSPRWETLHPRVLFKSWPWPPQPSWL